MHHLLVALFALGSVASLVPAQEGSKAQELKAIACEFPLLEVFSVAMGDAGDSWIGIGKNGEVRTMLFPVKDGDPVRWVGELRLPERDCLYDFVEVLGDGGAPELVTLSKDGLLAYRFEGDRFQTEAIRLDGKRRRQRASLDLRTGAPAPAPLGRDINADGVAELITPSETGCDLWARSSGEDNAYRRLVGLSARSRTSEGHRARDAHEDWEFRWNQSSLKLEDVNADGREDLVSIDGLRRSFYLQTKEGGFPEEPTVSIDASVFVDPTPSSGLRPGRVLAGSNRQTLQVGDINADGKLDVVIAHRRTIWVFRGGDEGPNFTEPAQILKSSQDITLLLLLNLNEDQAKDLVAIRVEVPSLGAIVVGALGGLEIEISAVGHRANLEGGFERKPTWRSAITVQLPSLSQLLQDPEAIFKRFEAVGERLENFVIGDLDADGKPDLVQVDEAARELQWWFAVDEAGAQATESLLKDFLFGAEERTWTLEDILAWVSKLVEGERFARTGNRPPDGRMKLRDASAAQWVGLAIGDGDGDQRDEVMLRWRVPGPPVAMEIERLVWPRR